MEIFIRIDMDGFSMSPVRDQIVPAEYRFVEVEHLETGEPVNIEVWESVEQEAAR